LHEGTNLLSVVATDSTGRTALSSLTVCVDQTAPILTIENPVVNAVTSASSIDIRGIVNDAVEGGVGAAEAVVKIKNSANNQEVTAQVSDRYYFGTDLPLEVGANDITVTATDGLGNARTKPLRVSRIAVGSKRITILDGNRQLGPITPGFFTSTDFIMISASGNATIDLRFNDLYFIIGTVSEARVTVAFKCEIVKFKTAISEITLLPGSYLQDLWDFDYTGTSTILFGAPNEFIVAGAKLQAGFLGNKNPVGAIYLNKFLLPAVNIPSVTFCLDIRCVRGGD